MFLSREVTSLVRSFSFKERVAFIRGTTVIQKEHAHNSLKWVKNTTRNKLFLILGATTRSLRHSNHEIVIYVPLLRHVVYLICPSQPVDSIFRRGCTSCSGSAGSYNLQTVDKSILMLSISYKTTFFCAFFLYIYRVFWSKLCVSPHLLQQENVAFPFL